MAYSFSLDSGNGNTNFRGWNLVKSPGQNAVQKKETPDVPIDNQGDLNKNVIVVSQMGFDVGGYNGTASIRYVVYENNGDYVFRTESASLPNRGTTVDLPRVNIDCSNAGINNGSTILSGGKTYGFGVWSVGPIGFQKQVNSSSTVYRDTSIGIGDDMSYAVITSDDENRTLIGKVFYFYLPSAPKNLAVNTVGSVSTLTWEAPTSDGGSNVTGYSIAYKPTASATWAYIDTRTLANPTTRSYAFNGLVGSYDFKVAAYNGASVPIGAKYASGTDAISKWSGGVGAQVNTLGPAVRIASDPEAWVNSEINVYRAGSVWEPCTAVYVYGGTPPVWQPLKGV
jgi:hypothetical protein